MAFSWDCPKTIRSKQDRYTYKIFNGGNGILPFIIHFSDQFSYEKLSCFIYLFIYSFIHSFNKINTEYLL